jgi:creatinine amidohydrolase
LTTRTTTRISSAMQLFDLPHEDARRALDAGAPVYLSINPVEYHGPHLPLHNDALVSAGLIRDLHRKLRKGHPEWPLLVASDLEIGVEPTPGPGSRFTSLPIARSIVREACRALAELGARRVVLMTFHGAPLHNVAIESGVDELRSRGVAAVAPFNILMQQLLAVDDVETYAPAFEHVEDAHEREEMLRTIHLDFHGGFFETSMTLHYAPDSVGDHRSLPPCPTIVPRVGLRAAASIARTTGASQLAKELELAAFGLGWQALRPFPGYTGKPHLARAQSGAFFAEKIVEKFAHAVDDVFEGRARSPAPIMAWAARLTFEGRISPMA